MTPSASTVHLLIVAVLTLVDVLFNTFLIPICSCNLFSAITVRSLQEYHSKLQYTPVQRYYRSFVKCVVTVVCIGVHSKLML